jgi:thioredoxin reductase (NADPH)
MISILKKGSIALVLCFFVPLFAKQAVDVVVIGGGVSALTSALYLARAGYTPVVIEGPSPGGALFSSAKVQNWPGEIEISGAELIDKIHRQVEALGVEFIHGKVMEVDFFQHPFKITYQNVGQPERKELEAKACLIATGSLPRSLGVEGEKKFFARGVYSCATCDGPLYKDKVVAVIGGGDAAIADAHYLSNIGKKVYLIVRGTALKTVDKKRLDAVAADGRVEILYDSEVVAFEGDSRGLSHAIIKSRGEKKNIDIDAAFVAVGASPNSDIFKASLALSENGFIKVGNAFETSVPGVFAAGDIVDDQYQQAISAAGDGAKAAMNICSYLSKAAPPKKQLSPPPAHVIDIKDLDHFHKEVDGSSIPVLVEFYASWCSPCRALKPILDSYARLLQGRVKIVKVNVNSCPKVADMYQIRAMPTLISLADDGKVAVRRQGSEEIAEYLQSFFVAQR